MTMRKIVHEKEPGSLFGRYVIYVSANNKWYAEAFRDTKWGAVRYYRRMRNHPPFWKEEKIVKPD